MTDYHPLIARAVEGLDKSTGEARRALYERARTALVTQLRAVEPALSESDITKERLALEEAIRKVEGEAARKARAEPRTQLRPASRFEPPPAAPAARPPRSATAEAGAQAPPAAAMALRRDRSSPAAGDLPLAGRAEAQRAAPAPAAALSRQHADEPAQAEAAAPGGPAQRTQPAAERADVLADTGRAQGFPRCRERGRRSRRRNGEGGAIRARHARFLCARTTATTGRKRRTSPRRLPCKTRDRAAVRCGGITSRRMPTRCNCTASNRPTVWRTKSPRCRRGPRDRIRRARSLKKSTRSRVRRAPIAAWPSSSWWRSLLRFSRRRYLGSGPTSPGFTTSSRR